MSPLAWIVNEQLLRAVTWTLVHFLWQGTLLALALMLATRLLRPAAAVRYAAGIITLSAMLVAPAITMTSLWPAPQSVPLAVASVARSAPQMSAPQPVPAAPVAIAPAVSQGNSWWFTFVPVLWTVGVLVLAVRFAGGWWMTRRLAHVDAQPVDATLEALVKSVAARIGLARVIRVVQSARVTSPVMFGWLRPVVLVPVATIAGLPPAQLEALIAHELVHVRRRDYVVNLLQIAAETMLFFHPAVWWVSREIRREREHCCDDIVVTVCDRVDYVRALAHVAEAGQLHVALGASDGSLLQRVERLLATPERNAPGWLPILLVTGTAALAPFGVMSADAGASASQEQSRPATPVLTAPIVMPAARVSPEPVAAAEAAPVPVVSPASRPRAATAPMALPQSDGNEARVEFLREHLEEIQAQYAAMQDRYSELQNQREAAKLAAAVAAAEDQLQAARARAERVNSQIETGLADEGIREVVLAQVREAERQLQVAQLELEFTTQFAELEQARGQRQRELQRVQAEYERAIVGRLSNEHSPFPTSAVASPFPQSSSSETSIEAGDKVVVEIEGGPSFGPPGFGVADDGTLRLPLVGTFAARGRRVADLTSDIRAALVRADFSPEPVVRVHILRER